MVVDSQSHAADLTLTTALARADDVGDPPANTYLSIRGADGGVSTTAAAPAGLPDLAALDRTTSTGATQTADLTVAGRDYRVLTERLGARTVQGALDLGANHQERDRLIATLLGAGLIGLALAAAAGAWLGARAVAPLDEALAAQRRFVADASHELRTPLTLLSTRAQMLRRHLNRPEPGERARGEADAVVRDSAHLAAILEDLLLAADPRTARADDAEIDLVDLVDAVVASCSDEAAARGVVLECHPAHRHPVRDDRIGDGPAPRRHRAGRQRNPARPRARRGHRSPGVATSLHVDVQDDGDGVDPRVAPHMFDRFATHHGDESPPRLTPPEAARGRHTADPGLRDRARSRRRDRRGARRCGDVDGHPARIGCAAAAHPHRARMMGAHWHSGRPLKRLACELLRRSGRPHGAGTSPAITVAENIQAIRVARGGAPVELWGRQAINHSARVVTAAGARYT